MYFNNNKAIQSYYNYVTTSSYTKYKWTELSHNMILQTVTLAPYIILINRNSSR